MKTINVSKGFFSRFKTIKNAVDYAKAGDTIVVEPDTYLETLYINKPITIKGNGRKEEIILKGGITIDSNVKIESISITKDIYQRIDFGLLVNAGKTIVTDCHITQIDGIGIQLKHNSQLEINNSTISYVHNGVKVYGTASFLIKGSNLINCTGNGISVVNNAKGIIDDCIFHENKSVQIALENGSDITIQNSKIHSSQSNGIYIENAKGTIVNCELYENSKAQINIVKSSNVSIKNSTIRLGKKETVGIYVANSSLEMDNSKINEHDYPKIYVTERSIIQLKKLKIYEGEGSGIRILNSSTGVIDECEIFNNGQYPNLSIEEDSNITIQNSKIHSSNGSGILFDRAKGAIRDCSFYQNRFKQIEIYNESEVRIINSAIYNGKPETNGIKVSGGSITDIDNCAISKHDYPQIFVEEKSKIYIKKSKVADGIGGGMRILGSTGLIDQCEFSNHGENPQISIESDSEITLQNCKVYSGQGYGISIDNAKGTINDCSLYENEAIQLEIDNYGYAEMNRCLIYNGKSNGVRVSGKATALLQDVNVYGHLQNYPQVVIKTGGNPIFRRCKIFDGQGYGVYFIQNGLGTIEDSYIYDNQDFNFYISEGSEPILRRNRILNGSGYGVYLTDSNPIIESCIFSNNDLDDIYIDENCKPVLLQNEFTSNSVKDAKPDADNSSIQYEEEALGFNPYNMEKNELKTKLLDEKKKWLNRINAPSIEKRQEAERMLVLFEKLEKELLVDH